ncbi:23S rRNA (uracil(1939)-C(5))-methyltransferase RlmD [Clostridium grantii]|uniref:23S rRNA m(5)U-1939 methyltransferase n=1 Tax=Clostridium grantii DSM 8605 TaxID=1121316 RepID=A0A1M5QGV8_9CLOT|nr:23S rRNA (uracil(1939)-C(5))-methyltransferase RlmD [Clostridium grantii]SHH12763.1 23S rRNA m(5)U-1939 methyltransferase [Clostridium grantii DSM 8605]
MKKRTVYELNIEGTEFPGYGVAFKDNKKILIKGTLPGQKVKAFVKKFKSGNAIANLNEIIEDVYYKIEPKCPVFNICGGCTHQFISYEKQLEFKKDQLLQLFDNAEIKDFEFLGVEGSPEIYEYRNKMEFTFGDMEKGGELCLGMHMKGRSFSIVTADECKIIDEDFNLLLKTVLDYFRKKDFKHYKIMAREGYLRNLVIRKGKNTGELMVAIVTTSQEDFSMDELTEILKGLNYKGKLRSLLHIINDSLSDTVQADEIKVLYGEDFITEEVLGLKFKITPFSFFQTNTLGAEKLYSLVRDFMGNSENKTVFDLYCGTGTIGQIVAQKAKKVIGVELIEEAVESAKENAKLNNLNNCQFIAGDVKNVIQNLKENPDIIILDPPRPGVHPVALDYVLKFNAKEIIYVSCNPKTLVNDLKVLLGSKYKITQVIGMDLFPSTPHLESIVKLVKI